MGPILGAVALFPLLLSLGCRSHQPVESELARATEGWSRSAARLEPGEAEAVPEPGLAEPMPSSPVSAHVMEALARNPSVKAAVADARAMVERVSQAGALPDPVLSAMIRPEPIRTAAGDAVLTLGLAQRIPLPARLDRAGRVAAAEVRMAIGRLNAVRLGLISDVEHAWLRLYLTDRSLELTAAHLRSLVDLEQVLSSGYRVGRVEHQDLLRMQTEISKLRDAESRLGRRRASAAAALNRLCSQPPSREIAATEPIVPVELLAGVDRLMELAAEHNPELALLDARLERDREKLELARLEGWPDASVGVEWTQVDPRDAPGGMGGLSESGDDIWALMLKVDLPLWRDRIRAGRREAQQRLASTRLERRAAEDLLAFRIHDAWIRVQAQQDTLEILESTLIPQARQTWEVSLTAHQAGRSSFPSVIDNWRRLLDFELMYHREVAELETALSELERQVGVQLLHSEIEARTAEPEGR